MEDTISFPDVRQQPVAWKDTEFHTAQNFRAIIDNKTEKVYSIVTKDYVLIRHEEAIEEVERVIEENADLGAYITSTQFYAGGGRMRRTYHFPEISVEIRQGDCVNPELHLLNSYDTIWPFTILLGAFRLVCSNGLVVEKKFLHLRKRHLYPLNELALEKEISTAVDRFDKQADQYKGWAECPLTEKTYSQVMKAMQFGKNATEEIQGKIRKDAEDLDDKGFPNMSLWVFFNVLTWYVTHRTVSLNHRVEMERRLRASIRYFRGR